MINLETFVALLVTILLSGSVAALSFYIKAKTSDNSRDKTYNNRGFAIILAITFFLAVASTVLYFYGKSAFKPLPLHSKYFSNSRFLATYVAESVLLMFWTLIAIFTLFLDNPTKKFFGYILKSLFILIVSYGLLWLNFFISYLFISLIQVESDLLFFCLTSLIIVFIYIIIFFLSDSVEEKFAKFL